MKELVINVEGMHCEGCENRIKNAIKEIDGIEEVNANHETGIVNVIVKKSVNEKEIKDTIEDIGFEVKE